MLQQRRKITTCGKRNLRGHSTISFLKNRFFVAFFDRLYIQKCQAEGVLYEAGIADNFFLQFLCSENFKRVFPETTFLRSVRTISQKVFNRLLPNFLRLF